MHVSAGNDGMTGFAARRILVAGVNESLKLRTGREGASELLIEFWWRDPGLGHTCSVSVMPYDEAGTPLFIGPLVVNSAIAGATLAPAVPSFRGVLCSTLFHDRCHRGMSCTALALSTKDPDDLKNLEIEIELGSTSDVVMAAWVVECTDRGTAFVEGGSDATLCVPSTAEQVISVAGVQTSGQPWSKSSRGPVYDYTIHTHLPLGIKTIGSAAPAPSVSYSVLLGHAGEEGTSFASPKACGDSAHVLLQPGKSGLALNPDQLIDEILAPVGGKGNWDHRSGWGVIPT